MYDNWSIDNALAPYSEGRNAGIQALGHGSRFKMGQAPNPKESQLYVTCDDFRNSQGLMVCFEDVPVRPVWRH